METAEWNARYAEEDGFRHAAGESAADLAAGSDGGETSARFPESFLRQDRREEPGDGPAPDSAQVQQQLAEIARMDPEMKDLGSILRSEAGPRFRDYVEKGLDFVDAYTLAARSRLAGLRDARFQEAAKLKAAGKGHLSATQSRGGEGDLPVPQDELELFRAMLPGTPDAEFRKYYNKNRRK